MSAPRTLDRTLLALADDLTELKTICACGRKATMNLRLDAGGNPAREGAQVEIGGNERYVAMCRRHYKEAISAPGAVPAPLPRAGKSDPKTP